MKNNHAWSEAAANEALEAQAEQDRIDARQLAAKEANEEERQRKHEKNMRFWHRIKWVVIAIVLAAAAIYLLMHWG